MVKTLYICGNGFDLHHHLGTLYRDYRCYLKIHAKHLLDWLEDQGYLENPELWNDLERNMDFDFSEAFSAIYDENEPNPFADGDSKWDALKYEVENEMDFLRDFTTTYFLKWIKTIDVSKALLFKDLEFPEKAVFVNFNYTDTLQRVYDISNSNVLHIHGSIANVKEEGVENIHGHIQFGNDTILKHENLERYATQYSGVELYEVMVEDAVREVVKIAETFAKDITKNFESLRSFVLAQGDFSEVVIMGHCLAGIDLPYYEKVLIPLLKNCKWTILCYSEADINNAKRFGESYGLTVGTKSWPNKK